MGLGTQHADEDTASAPTMHNTADDPLALAGLGERARALENLEAGVRRAEGVEADPKLEELLAEAQKTLERLRAAGQGSASRVVWLSGANTRPLSGRLG